MIKTEQEYQECLRRMEKDRDFVLAQRKALEASGLSSEEVERVLEATYSFNDQLKEEIEWYEHVKRRDFKPLRNLTGLGKLLIALRISNGLSQAELARRLKVDESQVCRDERNEYHGITIDRAQRVLNALGEHVVLSVEEKDLAEAG